MLKAILSAETCGKCRGCCYFDKTDLWEVPLITSDTAEYIKDNFESINLKKNNSLFSFDIPNLFDDELFICPMLTENGCILGDNKPFDCRIWPFRLMKNKNGNVSIAVSKYCKPVSEMSQKILENFLISSELVSLIKEYKNSYPESVKEFSTDYVFLNINI